MGASQSSKSLMITEQDPPEKLSDFKKLAMAPEQFNIPEIPQKRQSTDQFFLYAFLSTFVVLLILIIYTLVYTDIDRVLLGYDQCGNVCGRKNDIVEGINCSGLDMTDNEYLKFESVIVDTSTLEFETRECVESCDKNESMFSYFTKFHRCFVDSPENAHIKILGDDEDALVSFWHDVCATIGPILFLTLVSAALCLLVLVIFRYATAAIVWTIVIGSYLVLLCSTMYLFFNDDDSEQTYTFAISMLIILVVVTFVLVAKFKRIPLVINLFKEAVKAIFGMPGIMVLPFYTFLLVFLLIFLFIYLTVHLNTAGILTNVFANLYIYQPNFAMLSAICLHAFVFLWLWQFFLGCEIMLISGAVSTWYFSRDKTFLGRPIMDSFTNLFKYHTGSVFLGSLIITIIEVVQAVLKSMASNKKTRFLADCCLNYLKRFVMYISRNAYIQIAMHGESFFKSGKRAVRLLCFNLSDVVAINSIGDFVLFMAKFLIVALTIGIGMLCFDTNKEKYAVGIVFSALIAAALSHCVFKVFETAIDTVFLCYCEDCAINDGMERPYYMSPGLMQFFDESKAVLGTINSNNKINDINEV